MDPRWSSNRRIFYLNRTWQIKLDVEERKSRNREWEEGKRGALRMYDSILITVKTWMS